MNKIELIKKLSNLGERQKNQALKAAEMIKRILYKSGIPFSLNKFFTYIPVEKSAFLEINGKKLKAKNSGFVSGKINPVDISSSLISSRFLIDKGGINFNPLCRGISKSNFYFAPSLAVKAKDLCKIIEAKKIKAKVKVKKQRVISEQILVGNKINPKIIIFSHYDSIDTGAIDNASGTVVALNLVLKNFLHLSNLLFVFDGNEELSYDYPIYWGHGYRMFENKYKKIMKNCKKLIVIDSVGNGKPVIFTDKKILNLAFPIKNKQLLKKTITISGDIDKLMKIYHSNLDIPSLVKKEYLELTEKLVSINLQIPLEV